MHGLEAGEVEVEVASVAAEEGGASVTEEGSAGVGVGVVASMAAGVGASEGVAVTRHSNFATISWLVQPVLVCSFVLCQPHIKLHCGIEL